MYIENAKHEMPYCVHASSQVSIFVNHLDAVTSRTKSLFNVGAPRSFTLTNHYLKKCYPGLKCGTWSSFPVPFMSRSGSPVLSFYEDCNICLIHQWAGSVFYTRNRTYLKIMSQFFLCVERPENCLYKGNYISTYNIVLRYWKEM